ncbi:MAG: hypothetical protein KFF77_06660 [Bacteroidetes bacterium]|nr:hypothetical protein [Bacteroidota bacterium]
MKQTSSIWTLFQAFLSLLLMTGAPADLHAQGLTAFRGGVQVGLSAERSSYSWPDAAGSSSTLDVEARQNGFLGMLLDFPISPSLLLEIAPQYGQRNVPIATLQRRGGVQFSIRQDPVDYLAIPILLKYLFLRDGLILPYAGAGVVFGMNLSALSVTIEEVRFLEEPPFSATMSSRRNLNQLFGAAMAEAGLDIRAAEQWSVLLGVGYMHELTPMLDDPLLTWETPRSWKIRFALLYTFGRNP